MLLIKPHIVILQGTGSQVTPGFPHSQIRLRVASPKVREYGRTTPVAYELASDTWDGLGVVTCQVMDDGNPLEMDYDDRDADLWANND